MKGNYITYISEVLRNRNVHVIEEPHENNTFLKSRDYVKIPQII